MRVNLRVDGLRAALVATGVAVRESRTPWVARLEFDKPVADHPAWDDLLDVLRSQADRWGHLHVSGQSTVWAEVDEDGADG